jgi:hypothetical protein
LACKLMGGISKTVDADLGSDRTARHGEEVWRSMSGRNAKRKIFYGLRERQHVQVVARSCA